MVKFHKNTLIMTLIVFISKICQRPHNSVDTVKITLTEKQYGISIKGGIKLRDKHDYDIKSGPNLGLQFYVPIDNGWSIQHELDY
ncbi:MAG: hypothetical protein NTX22_02140 [Ignavibacteriales bacterium]|nr:hypothetical protein [Ignavibacteriales bacterium]